MEQVIGMKRVEIRIDRYHENAVTIVDGFKKRLTERNDFEGIFDCLTN